ncbi:MAG: DNA-binding response regulator [Flammeovirgaceae bacterium]|nr:DNA-binding response regulator [Flammeovirgaceae bacterium]MBE61746.1 DNA-binding response regulator [Flammeovirgaceae bacterium]MBR06633.1 DNA-binding response regulator [Rickettsiales bacterium]HCX24093.1 DNA-binding response regulator [Cytophagales bacterium]|tara:strand:- start:1512 stop:2165 length:654 start_codon:yes stop_codon:yes gene_type:complete
MNKKRLLLVEDHEIVRDAFRFYFAADEEFEIVAEANNGQEALQILENDSFDIIITDINMPVMDGVAFVQSLRDKGDQSRVLVLSMFDDIKSIKKMLTLQINGYVLKDTGKGELVKALNSILDGVNYFSEEVARRVMESMSGPNIVQKQRLTIETELSPREKEVLRLILEEKSNQEIADTLFISVRTVEGHKNNMLTKTGCKNLVGLTMYAIEHNLVD